MTLHEFIPREHGAWAMWIAPMLSAALVTHFSLYFFLLFICFALLYVVHHPVVLMLKRKGALDRKDIVRVAAVGLPALALGAGLIVFGGLPWLLAFGAVELAIFASSIKSFLDRDQRSFISEIVTVIALTLSAPAAYYTITRSIDVTALILYLLNFLFSASSIFYVKMRIEYLRFKGDWVNGAKRARNLAMTYHLILLIALACAVISGVLSVWVAVGFVPMLVQVAAGGFSRKTRMNFTRLGIALVVQSAIFLSAVGVFLR